MRDWTQASIAALFALSLSMIAAPANADDGYRLWLRYDSLPSQLRQRYAASATEIVMPSEGPVAASAASELRRGLSGLLGVQVPEQARIDRDGAVVGEISKALTSDTEGFAIRSERRGGH